MAANAAHPITIERQKDGRHAVMAADGTLLGQHNSVFSAARQVHEYYGGGTPATGTAEADKVPKAPKHSGVGAPKLHRNRVPRP